MVWGELLHGRTPRLDDGAWCAFTVNADWPSGENRGRVMWYNHETNEHRWAMPSSPAARKQMVEIMAIQATRAYVADITHSNSTEIVHSIVHSQDSFHELVQREVVADSRLPAPARDRTTATGLHGPRRSRAALDP